MLLLSWTEEEVESTVIRDKARASFSLSLIRLARKKEENNFILKANPNASYSEGIDNSVSNKQLNTALERMLLKECY